MANYVITVVPEAHKNAANVVFALRQGENPALSENIGQPLNTSGSPEDLVTHWMGGRPYDDEELAIVQDLASNMPSASWPISGVSGSVTEQNALDAVAALYFEVGVGEAINSTLIQATLAKALSTLGLQRVRDEE
jgi:hypothetical protein